MEVAHSSPNVLVLAKDPEHLARLEEANKLLEEIQKVRLCALDAPNIGCKATKHPLPAHNCLCTLSNGLSITCTP
jgi:hypothetical protein